MQTSKKGRRNQPSAASLRVVTENELKKSNVPEISKQGLNRKIYPAAISQVVMCIPFHAIACSGCIGIRDVQDILMCLLICNNNPGAKVDSREESHEQGI